MPLQRIPGAMVSDGTIQTTDLANDLTIDLASGSAAAPSVRFDSDTGFYSPGSGAVAIASDGVAGVQWPKIDGSLPNPAPTEIYPLREVTAWQADTYNGYWSISAYRNNEGLLTGGIAYYGEKYTEVLNGVGVVISGNTHIHYVTIGDGNGGGSIEHPHFVSAVTTRPDGRGRRDRFEIKQDGQWVTNYHDYPGWTSTQNGFNGGPAFFCRAWGDIKITAGVPSIAKSGNLTSVTDLGVGSFRFNMTTAMPDSNFACIASGSASVVQCYQNSVSAFDVFQTNTAGTAVDASPICAAVFR